jgi:adenylate cyclase class IV
LARNIEIKARVADPAALLARALALPGALGPTLILQDDSFYAVPQGRLKLRRLGDGSAELIAYLRADVGGPKLSQYQRVPVPDAAALHAALAAACGESGRVVKRRQLVRVGATRIHLDEVQGLGHYMELEVVLGEHDTPEAGEATAQALMAALGIAPQALCTGAYVDLLAAAAARFP